jgi:anti-sigma regulatory factor (Ser/Thr protein kinase)
MKKNFERSLDSLGKVFQFTERFLDQEAIDDSLRFPINFSIEELFTNMVKYNSEGPDRILLKLKRKLDRIEVSLVDSESEPFDITRANPADTTSPLEKREPGGLGLHLIRKMVDRIDYKYADGCSKITFTKLLGLSDV